MKTSGRRLGVALAFMVAAMSVATASASALTPEFNFSFPNSISYSGGQMAFEDSSNIAVTCETITGTTTISGFKQIPSSLTLKGCSLNFFGIKAKCSSAGAAEGEVVANTVTARLEYISKAAKEVALVLNYGGKNSTIAAFKCGSQEGAIRGEVVAKITPVGTITTKFPIAFKGAKGVQELTQYENEKAEKVTVSPLELGIGGSFAKTSLNSTSLALLFSNSAEIQG